MANELGFEGHMAWAEAMPLLAELGGWALVGVAAGARLFTWEPRP